mmetsp:Transcript_64395/g.155703  ORF Transcript_64395/g.155703 Transcript_64395/m.155703 type:complete len:307 (+) Transcript_64395:1-921(+)
MGNGIVIIVRSQHSPASLRLHLLGTQAAGVLVDVELDALARRHGLAVVQQVLLMEVDLPIALLRGGVLQRRRGLDPSVGLPPLQHLALDLLLGDTLAGQVGAAGLCLPGPVAPPAAPGPAPALAPPVGPGVGPAAGAALVLAAPFALGRRRRGRGSLSVALGLLGLLVQLLVLGDLHQGYLRSALLRLLLRGEDLAGPKPVLPLPRQGRQLHRGLVAAGDPPALVCRLAFLQVPLCNPHAQGVQLGLGCDGWVIAVLWLRALRCGGLRRDRELREARLQSLLGSRLLCLLGIGAEVPRVLLRLEAV